MTRNPPKAPEPPQAPDAPIELLGADVLEITEIDDVISLDDGPSQANAPFTIPQAPPAPTQDEFLDFAMPPPPQQQQPQRQPAVSLNLDDLPAPSMPDMINIDLPAPAPLLTPLAAAPPSHAPTLDFDDLPALPVEMPPQPDSIDLSQSPPSLMDDLPAEPSAVSQEWESLDASTSLELSDSTPPPSHDAQAMDLSDLPDLAAPDMGGEMAAVGPSLGDTADDATAVTAARTKRGSRKKGLAVATAGALLVLGVVGVLWFTPLGRTLGLRSPPPPPPVTKVVAKGPAAAKAAPTAVVAEERPLQPTIDKATRDNIDHLSYASLLAAVQGGNGTADAHGLAAWSQFRLAYGFANNEARSALQASLAEKPDPHGGPLGLSAAAAAAVLYGKPLQQKKALAKLKGPVAKTPQAMFVLALQLEHAKKVPKAQAMLDKVISLAPRMVDPALLRAEWLLNSPRRPEGDRALLELARQGDPDVTARVAQTLLRADDYMPLDEATETLADGKKIALAAPAHQDILWRLLVRHRLHQGDQAAAVKAASKRVQAAPGNSQALIELGRLTQYSGGDGTKVLTDGLSAVPDTDGQARVCYEILTQARLRKDDAAVQAALKQLLTLPAAEAAGWLQLAEGDVSAQAGDLAKARQSYSEAGRGKPNFDEPRLAQALLAPLKADQQTIALTKLLRRPALPQGLLRLAQSLETQGDWAGARRVYEALWWNDPSVQDPLVLNLKWIDTIDRSGEALRAETLAEALSIARPDDDRPPLQIIDMARRGKRWEVLLKWYGTLLTRHPNHRIYTVQMANGYIDAGKPEQALKTLEALAKVDPEARDADYLFTMGRAWGAQDVVKARGFLQESIKAKAEPRAYILLGELEQGRGKADEAMQAYRDALALNAEQPTVRLRLVKLLIMKGFTKEAVDELQAVLAKNPRDSEAGEMLGDALHEQGENPAALAAYEKAELSRSGHAPLLMKMARLQLQELGNVPMGVKTLKRVVKDDPKNAEAQYYLGVGLRDLGKSTEARSALQNYVHLAPQGEFIKEARQTLEDLTHR